MQTREWLAAAERLIPRHEAEQILERALQISPLEQRTSQDRVLLPKELERLLHHARRRALGEPLQYVTGDAPFFGRYFQVSPAVLIPRPETEVLVDEVLSWMKENTRHLKAQGKWVGAELGVGSGCISVSLLLEQEDLQMVASDINPEALRLTNTNAELLGVQGGRLNLILAEDQLFEIFANQGAPFDFVVSNPPYLIQQDEIESGVLGFEPKEALFSKESANQYYLNAAKYFAALVKQGGAGFFEIPHERAREIEQIFLLKGFKTHVVNDLSQRPRVLQVNHS
jgi:release factor glutamine methyltransferase